MGTLKCYLSAVTASLCICASRAFTLPSPKALLSPGVRSPLWTRQPVVLANSDARSSRSSLQSSLADEPEVAAGEDKFDWWKQWYPVAVERDMDPTTPHKVTLLARDLVLWKDGNEKKWRCFIDSCPHRLAPLSEGRIEPRTGHLQCAYHGWEWDEKGGCTKIPQADHETRGVAAHSKRACATSLPTVARQGMIWVWPDTSPEGLAASEITTPNVMEGVNDEDMSYLVVARDMPYGFDTLLENGIDPSHLPFAHHKIISNRNQASFIDINVQSISKEGFDSDKFYPRKSSTRKSSNNATVAQSLHFRPPNLLYQVINFTDVLNALPVLPKKERVIRIVTYAVPTAPGRARVIYRFFRNFFVPPPFLRWIAPQWLEHLRIMRVLDSDTVFLHGQERELALHPAGEIDKAYYMPTPADGSVRALRKWIARFGGPKWLIPVSNALPPMERNRRLLLDRYESHTKNCKVCSGALRNIRRLRHLIGFLSVMAFYLGLLGQSVYTRLSGGFLTVLGLTGALLIRNFEERFHYQEWNHGHNH